MLLYTLEVSIRGQVLATNIGPGTSALSIDITGYKHVVFVVFLIFFWDLEVGVSNKKMNV